MKKVLMIGPDREVQGGISAVVNNYYNAGLENKVELTYISTMVDGSKFQKLKVAISSFIKFGKEIRKNNAIVHVHMSSRASFYRKSLFILFAKLKERKVIIHMHGSEFEKFYKEECNKLQKKYVQYIFNKSEIVLALSQEWKEILSKITHKDKIIVMHNAIVIPPKQRKNDKKDKTNILMLGRLGKRKGTYDLLKIIPELIKKYPNVQFLLGGDGDVDNVKRICEERGIQNNVKLLGWVKGDDKIKYLREADIFVLPSYHEGMPMAILEAMAYGLPIVSTFVGGIPQVINNGKEGLLINAGDTNSLRNSLDILISNYELRRTMGEQAYKRVHEYFNLEKIINNLLDVYNVIS